MPFVKKNDVQGSQPSTDAHSIFIGRTGELLFFVQNILKSVDPTHNIISISGQGGVGKSTLLTRFIDEAHSPTFKDYCLTAIVDERQTTAASIMEKFAGQLGMTGKFEKALRQYKATLHKLQTERETIQDTILHNFPDFACAAAESMPVAGPLLREGVKAGTKHLLGRYYSDQIRKDAEILEDPVDDLTKAFVEELNHLAETQVMLSNHRVERLRIILFFDTFEQLAAEAAPWLLNHFLTAQVSSNVVLVIAGRDPIEHTSRDDPKRWLPYCDDGTIYWISLNSFTEDETGMYLVKRGITDADQIANIWYLSRGLPFYLGLLTSNPHGDIDPTKGVVVNFLRWIPQKEQIKRDLALDAALLSRPFNQDDLEVFSYVSESDRAPLYQWLIEQPFVRGRSQDGRYVYHDVARELFSRHLYQRSQKHYYEIRRALATYYQGLLEKIQAERGEEVYRSEEWLELTIALAHQLFLLPDKESHTQAIEQMFTAYSHAGKAGEIVRLLHELAQGNVYSQVSVRVQQSAGQLLKYMELQYSEDEGAPQGFLAAVQYLFEQVANEQSCSTELVASLYYQRGVAYVRLKQYKQAIADYDQAITLNPKPATFFATRGNAYRGLHKDCEEVVAGREPPESINADLYHRRGDAYQRLVEDYERAIADYSQAITLEPRANRYHNRGNAHYMLEQYEQAIADYDQAEALDPNDAGLYHNRGNAYYHLGQYERASADYSRAIKLEPSARRYHNRGKAYRRLKKYEQALADHNRALELASKEDWYYAGRGLTYLWLKDINQARTDYIRGRELNPTSAYNGWMVEWLRICQEGVDLATAGRLESIAAADSLHDRACICRGVALWIRGYVEEALAELESAISSLGREKWAIYFWEGMIRASFGQEDEAVVVLKKALRMHLPPVLLSPLRYLEQRNLDFYKNYALPLLGEYDLS